MHRKAQRYVGMKGPTLATFDYNVVAKSLHYLHHHGGRVGMVVWDLFDLTCGIESGKRKQRVEILPKPDLQPQTTF